MPCAHNAHASCRTSTHGDSGSESDGDEVNRWNLRKCSAAGLDILSTVFGDELLPLIIPIVEQRLQVAPPLLTGPIGGVNEAVVER